MIDDDYVDVKKPAAKKSRASGGGKKAIVDPHAQAKQLVQSILGGPATFPVPLDEVATRAQLLSLAQYASALAAGEVAGAEGTRIVKAKSVDEVAELAEKLRRTVRSQIQKQMVVRRCFDDTRCPSDCHRSGNPAARVAAPSGYTKVSHRIQVRMRCVRES